MNIICYIFIFAFELFISYLYFKSKYTLKRKTSVVLLCFFIAFVVQYAINLINNPYLNLLSFIICNLLIVLLCFNASVKQSVFNVALLAALMITTETVVMYLFSALLGIDLLEYQKNDLIFFLETAATKTLYFIVAYIIAKISKKSSPNSAAINRYSVLLFILPLSSIFVISSYAYLSFNYETNKTTNILFTCSSLVMLIANIIIFIIHEKIIDILTKNTQLELEKQKASINKEYYTELEQQYESSNILIHDIKKCLANIKVLTSQNDNKKTADYIDSIYNGYEIKKIKQYSSNKLVNVIVSRYAQLCYGNKIDFQSDIRNIDFSFIEDAELTALLDNLIENAYEAAVNSEKKFVKIEADYRNENYIFIKITNSADNVPRFENGLPITTKETKNHHGIGTKSIYRIVKKYNGNLEYNYIESDKIFITSVFLKTSKQ